MRVNYVENERCFFRNATLIKKNDFCLCFLCSVMRSASKLTDFTFQHLVLSLSPACQVPNSGLSALQLDTLPSLCCRGSVFSEATCSFKGLFVVVGFYSFSWYFISVLPLREEVERKTASHPGRLCISLYLDRLFPVVPPSHHPEKKGLRLAENLALLGSA